MSGAEDLFKVQCSKFKGETKMVRLSYELSVMFDHNPIIEIGHRFRKLFKVGLRFDPILPRFSSSVCCGAF